MILMASPNISTTKPFPSSITTFLNFCNSSRILGLYLMTSFLRSSYTGPLKEDLKKLVIKYKPRILEELQKFKKVVIEEGKGLVVEMLGDAIKIIIKGGIGYEAVEENSFADMWEKVKAKVAKMKDVVREITMKKLDKYKPQIMDAVQHLKDVVIACGKDVVITVKDGIIKVIVDGGVVEEKPEYIY